MTPEEVFRNVESKLDHLVKLSEAQLKAENIKIFDVSGRSYNYKNSYLSWSFYFQRDIERKGFVERVTTFLTYMEPVNTQDEPLVDYLIKAEKFLPSQTSEANQRIKQKIPLSRIESMGIYSIILEADDTGRKIFSPQFRLNYRGS